MRLIDADAYSKKVCTYNETGCGSCTVQTICPFDEPTMDATLVRHGKFIGTEYDGYADGSPVYYEWKCSECGCIFEDDEPTYNYCPNCGARMDADEK